MNRWPIRLIVFVFATAIGISSGWCYLSAERTVVSRFENSISSVEIPDWVQNDGFVTEFSDLPNIEQIEQPNLTTKLVDVDEFVSSYIDGIFRKPEKFASNGELWLGLFRNKDEFRFQPIKTFLAFEERSLDPEQEDWYSIKFNKKGAPIFLIKGSKTIRPGSVATIAARLYNTKDELRLGYNGLFSLNDKNYIVRVVPGITIDGTKVNVLVLESGDSSEVVTYNLYYKDQTTLYDAIGKLLFVGDLDGDLKLDLYISDFGFEKGGFGTQLFLSSEADPGRLVKLVATFGTPGC